MESRNRSSLSKLTTLLCSLFLANIAVADPEGTYQGWIWERGVFGDGILVEEHCFGNFKFVFEIDQTWVTDSVGSIDVCWGRQTTLSGRGLFNVPFTMNGDPEGEAQSTRPLVNAGGKLFELFGEDIDFPGEERFATLLVPPSDDNLLMFGQYEAFSDGTSIEEFRFIDLFVKATPAVRNLRTAASLVGTSWRGFFMSHQVATADASIESAAGGFWSYDFGAAGACSFSVSDVFPDFTANNDFYSAIHISDAENFDDRIVTGGLNGQEVTSCAYSIDLNKNLEVTTTIVAAADPNNPLVAVNHFELSDDNRYMITAAESVLVDNSQALFLGYAAANGVATSLIDGTYLFYLTINEFGADGAGALLAGFGDRGWQEFDLFGRGMVAFSGTPGVTPIGENGSWLSCSFELVINQFEHEFTGLASTASVTLGVDSGPSAGEIPFIDCDYQLGADGGLGLYVKTESPEPDGGFEGIFRGYVSDNGEIMGLIQQDIEVDPLNPGNSFKDVANIKSILGVKYTGSLTADADGDGLSNFGEFKYPLPAQTKISGDQDGDGKSDILLRNVATGANFLYLMDGIGISQGVGVSSVPAEWEIVGHGDYNGDSKADILWHHVPSGAYWIYLMDGNSISSSVFVGTITDSNWKVVGNGDYNGDNNSDILWHHAVSGTVWLYEMDSNTILGSAGIGVVPDLDWVIVGSGDYNGDGRSDVLWRNVVSGTNWMYLMDGQLIIDSVGISTTTDLNWEIVASGDYDGDGKDDILWRHATSGTNWVYLMDGTVIATSASISVLPDANWVVVGEGDYNGDGMSDVLWRNLATGSNWMYLMQGLNIIDSNNVSTVVDQNWTIVGTR